MSAAAVGSWFQFTPARGGRHLVDGSSIAWAVSIHARARRATRFHKSSSQTGGFNSRPRAAGDALWTYAKTALSVSIHARARRATWSESCVSILFWFQFTPARGGRLRFRVPVFDRRRVSIHARARRATFPRCLAAVDALVSIHARARRATGLETEVVYAGVVSIHARARRATPPPFSPVSQDQGFNSRPRAAGDTYRPGDNASMTFQFTPARGGRPSSPSR